MTERTMTQDEAEEYVWGDHVAIQEVSEHRWYRRQLVIIKDESQALLGFYYLRPATEVQDDQDRFESDPVQVFPVVAKEVVRTVYERFDKGFEV